MDSANNNYNPFSGFNPQTALTDVRNSLMDAYGQMNTQTGGRGAQMMGAFQQLPQQLQGMGGGLPPSSIFNQGGQQGGGVTAGFGDAPSQQNGVGMPQGGPWATQPLPQQNPFAPMGGGQAQMPMQQMQMPQGMPQYNPAQQGMYTPQYQPTQQDLMQQFPQGQAQGQFPQPFMPNPQQAMGLPAPNPQQVMQGGPTGYNPQSQGMAQQPYMPPTGQGGGIGGGAGQFGLPVGQGTPGGGPAVDWLKSQGMPIPSFLQQASDGQPIGGANYNETLTKLGDAGGLPSLQSLNNLNPSEQAFLQGFFETVLGIPYADVVAAAQRPFAGLGQATQGRANWR